MKRLLFVALAMLLVFCVLPASAQSFAPRADISIIKLKPMNFHGKTVKVYGIISNAQMRENIDPLDQYRWEFDVTDASKETLHVLAKKNAPANGIIKNVTGTIIVDASQVPIMQLRTGGPIGLIIALIVLVMLAVVLVVQLARKPEATSPVIDDTISAPPPLPSATTCSNCGALLDPTAAFCEACGQRVRGSSRDTIVIPPGGALANLTVVAGVGARHGTQHSLSKEQKLKIGRGPGVNIEIDDEYASKEHAVIWWQDGSFYVQDEASSNGTLVNGQRITRQELKDNDSIQIGNTKFVFKAIAMANQPALL